MPQSKLPLALLGAAVCFIPAVFYAGPESLPGPAVEIQTEKNVITEEKEARSWTLNIQAGYWSEYLFRGTNLTPNSDGILYQQAYISMRGFTLGVWFANQQGRAVVPGATAVGESGSGISPFNLPGVFQDVAVQSRFKEVDVFSSYTHSFGPLDVTVGNIAFFIFRSAVDEFHFTPFGPNDFITYAVPEDEEFDRLFIALSTSKIHPFGISIIPTVTYYQTVYNHADPIVTHPGEIGPAPGESDEAYELRLLGFVRNDTLGGYLEGKVQTVVPIIKDVLRLQSTALISYSAGDRSEAVMITPAQIGTKSSARPLYGFNHFQTGTELVLQITKEFSLSGFGDYAHHIASPVAGTDKNEEWGGVYATLSF